MDRIGIETHVKVGEQWVALEEYRKEQWAGKILECIVFLAMAALATGLLLWGLP
jgi:hypothetical protein